MSDVGLLNPVRKAIWLGAAAFIFVMIISTLPTGDPDPHHDQPEPTETEKVYEGEIMAYWVPKAELRIHWMVGSRQGYDIDTDPTRGAPWKRTGKLRPGQTISADIFEQISGPKVTVSVCWWRIKKTNPPMAGGSTNNDGYWRKGSCAYTIPPEGLP